MPNFRTSVFLAAILLVTGTAHADDATVPAQQGPVTDVTPDEDAQQDVPDVPDATGPVDQTSRVSVGDINVLDGDPVGLIDEGAGGLGPDMWVNSRRDELERLLTALPVGTNDLAIRSLARRLLLTASLSPVGAGKRALITIRIEKLMQGGMIEDAGALAAKARLPHDSDFARVQADALLLSGNGAEACSDTTEERLTNGETFWLELRAYCYAVSGDTEQVELIDQLLEAQGRADPAYKMLRDNAIQHLNYMPGAIANPTSLDVYLIKAAGMPVPAELVDRFHLTARPAPVPENAGFSVPADALADAAAAFAPKVPADLARQRHAALMLDLAGALGDPVDLNTQNAIATVQSMSWSGARPSPDEVATIDQAASDQGRRGEAVLRVIKVLNARDIGAMAPDAVAYLVHTMKNLGCESEARSMAAHAVREYQDVAPPPVTAEMAPK